MARRLTWLTVAVSALLLVGSGDGALAQGAASSFNPAAAASDTGNPSSINPAARASDTRDSTSINPAAAASDSRRFGVAIPDSRSNVSSRPALSRTVIRPGRRIRRVERARARGARPAVQAPNRAAKRKTSRTVPQRKAERAAAGILGSVCRGC